MGRGGREDPCVKEELGDSADPGLRGFTDDGEERFCVEPRWLPERDSLEPPFSMRLPEEMEFFLRVLWAEVLLLRGVVVELLCGGR